MPEDLNCLSYWFPRIEQAGLKVPVTKIRKTDIDLTCMLDGIQCNEEIDAFLCQLQSDGRDVGNHEGAYFLRTGHGSGKHGWRSCCFVADPCLVGDHVFNLVEWSNMVDFFGLPTNVWASRELIPTAPVAIAPNYYEMPLVKEFRFFSDGQAILHHQPYWPRKAIAQGGLVPDELYEELALINADTLEYLCHLAMKAVQAIGCESWSIDFLQDRDGDWWLTDMALAESSFRYDPMNQEEIADSAKPPDITIAGDVVDMEDRYKPLI